MCIRDRTPAIRLDMTAFFEKQKDGFSSSAQYIPFSYREYDYLPTAQLRPEYKDGQVWVNGKAVPYQEKYSYTPVSVPVNTPVSYTHLDVYKRQD